MQTMRNYFFLLLLLLWSCSKTNGNNEGKTVDAVDSTNVSQRYYFYIGTYTDGGSKGIYKAIFDAYSGTISSPELAATITNASFQCISADRRLLFSVCESWSGAGSVTGYRIDTITGNLSKTEVWGSLGNGPCYVDFEEKTMNVVTSNYNSGNVTNIPVTAEGKTDGIAFSHQHKGKGPNVSRQEGPHAHCSKVDPTGKFVYSCDLGADKIYVYTLTGDSLSLFKTITTVPGSGPRHLDFHPQQKSMAVIFELNGTVTTYLPDADGCFSIENNTISTIPDSFTGQNKCADIHYSTDGKYLFASNRGHNSIACFNIDNASQKATFIGWQTENLITTRNFAVDPTGKYIVAANQDGNSITVYKIDQLTGEIRFTGISRTISKPVCITFLTSSISL
jgi:6-phosphogluconolactonase